MIDSIDHILNEAAEEAKQRSIRKLLKEAKKRKRQAKKKLSANDTVKVVMRKKILERANKDLEENEKWIAIMDRYQAVLAEQQRALRQEHRKRVGTVKNAAAALENAQCRFADGNKAQEEVSLLEQKLKEV